MGGGLGKEPLKVSRPDNTIMQKFGKLFRRHWPTQNIASPTGNYLRINCHIERSGRGGCDHDLGGASGRRRATNPDIVRSGTCP